MSLQLTYKSDVIEWHGQCCQTILKYSSTVKFFHHATFPLRELILFSTFATAALKTSLHVPLPGRISIKIDLTDLTILSQESPLCGEVGGINCRSIFGYLRSSSLKAIFSISFSSTQLAPLKFITLSDRIRCRTPRQLINCLNTSNNESVDNVGAISIYTVRIVIHVNNTPQRFSLRLIVSHLATYLTNYIRAFDLQDPLLAFLLIYIFCTARAQFLIVSN